MKPILPYLCALLFAASSFSGCAFDDATAPSSGAPSATPVLPTSSLAEVTKLTQKAISEVPAAAKYVETVANTVRQFALKNAPSPFLIQTALAIVEVPVPQITGFADEFIAWYTRVYPAISAAENASPIIEQVAEAVEAGAAPAPTPKPTPGPGLGEAP